MLMDLRPPAERRRRLTTRQSRLLRIMLAGSLLIHVLALLAVWFLQPEPPVDDDRNESSDQVAMVFESPGAKEASTQAPAATQASATPTGNVNATTTQPNPDTSAPLPPATPPAPTPPVPTPPAPTPPPPTPPEPAPPVAEPPAPPASAAPTPSVPEPEPPKPEEPPQPQPAPPTPRPPPTVTLSQDDGPALPLPPRFVMPQPPPPLPPLPPRPAPPRLAPPRQYARPSTSNPFGAPQDWSLNTAPSQQQPGRPSRGLDLSTGDFAGQKDATLGYVAGAHPTGDWIGALRRWTTARLYYPEQAIADHAQGTSVLLLTIARSGRVLNVQLMQSARSPFLDGAWMDIFRGATVPGFTPDMTEDSTQITYTLHYRLVMH